MQLLEKGQSFVKEFDKHLINTNVIINNLKEKFKEILKIRKEEAARRQAARRAIQKDTGKKDITTEEILAKIKETEPNYEPKINNVGYIFESAITQLAENQATKQANKLEQIKDDILEYYSEYKKGSHSVAWYRGGDFDKAVLEELTKIGIGAGQELQAKFLTYWGRASITSSDSLQYALEIIVTTGKKEKGFKRIKQTLEAAIFNAKGNLTREITNNITEILTKEKKDLVSKIQNSFA